MDYQNLKGDMTDCLMGNLHQDFDAPFVPVAKFIRAKLVIREENKVPAPLSHGKPLIPEEARGEVMDHAADRQPA